MYEIDRMLKAIEQGDWESTSRILVIADCMDEYDLHRDHLVSLRCEPLAKIIMALYYTRTLGGKAPGLETLIGCIDAARNGYKMLVAVKRIVTSQNVVWRPYPYDKPPCIKLHVNGLQWLPGDLDSTLWNLNERGEWVFNAGGTV